jgi:integrase
MPSKHSDSGNRSEGRSTLVKVANTTHLYKLALPGDQPGKPTGRYYALIKRGRKQFRRSLKTTHRKLADRRLRKLLDEIGNLDTTADTSRTFDQVARKWVELTSHTLKPRSIERRETSLKGLSPYFRGVTLRNITKAHCERWLTRRGATISAQSFAHELGAMKRVFDFAVEQGLVLGNPASHIRRRRIPQARIQVPSREQFQELIASIRHSDGRVSSQLKAAPGANLVELLAYSGMRLGEARALTWRDVNFKAGTITVTGGEAGTKNREQRVVPMTGALQALLTRLKKQPGLKAGDRVHPSRLPALLCHHLY